MTIFEYTDERSFLREYIHRLPRNGRGEISRIALHLGVHSSFISQILAGTKDFNIEQAQELAIYLGLNSIETDYFILLVQISRAGTAKLKTYFNSKLDHIKKQSLEIAKRIPQDRKLSEYECSVFYSSWLYLACWLYCSIDEGKTLENMASRFDIPRARAAEVIEFLLETQLIRLENDLYKMGPQLIHLDRSSPFLVKHHINWRVKAIQRSEDLLAEEVMFTSPLSISRKTFEAIREQIVDLINKTSDKVSKSSAEELACLNIDLFWVKR